MTDKFWARCHIVSSSKFAWSWLVDILNCLYAICKLCMASTKMSTLFNTEFCHVPRKMIGWQCAPVVDGSHSELWYIGPEGTAGISNWLLDSCVVLNAVKSGSSVVCGGDNPDASCCSAEACYDSTSWDQYSTSGPFQSLEANGKLTCSQQYEPACCPVAPQGPWASKAPELWQKRAAHGSLWNCWLVDNFDVITFCSWEVVLDESFKLKTICCRSVDCGAAH